MCELAWESKWTPGYNGRFGMSRSEIPKWRDSVTRMEATETQHSNCWQKDHFIPWQVTQDKNSNKNEKNSRNKCCVSQFLLCKIVSSSSTARARNLRLRLQNLIIIFVNRKWKFVIAIVVTLNKFFVNSIEFPSSSPLFLLWNRRRFIIVDNAIQMNKYSRSRFIDWSGFDDVSFLCLLGCYGTLWLNRIKHSADQRTRVERRGRYVSLSRCEVCCCWDRCTTQKTHTRICKLFQWGKAIRWWASIK